MADVWMGLCAEGHQHELMRALKTVDTSARLVFVADAEELRARFLRSAGQMGAIVGMVDEGVSAVNVAAAVARDAMAAQVVLVVRDRAELERCHAQNAGVDNVVVLTELTDSFGDLDEPDLVEDELPTMVAGMQGRRGNMSILVPSVTSEDSGSMAKESAGRKAEDSDEGPRVTPVGASSSMLNTGRSKGPRVAQGGDARPQALRSPREESHVSQAGANASRTSARADAPKGSVIVLVSGRGGVGKTALSAVMAYAAASWGMSVALCDLDLSCGNLYHAFGLRGAVDLAGPLENGWPGREEVLALGEEAAPGIHLWGSCARPEMAETVTPHVADLLSCLADSHDLLLVDTSTTFTDAVAQAAQACDRLVLVVDGLPGSDVAQARLGALAVRLGVARTRVVRLANRAGRRGREAPAVNHSEVGLETARSLRVADGGSDVTQCLAEGKVEDLFALDSRFAGSASTALAQLLAELGKLPEHPDAKRALTRLAEKSRWGFGRRREAS